MPDNMTGNGNVAHVTKLISAFLTSNVISPALAWLTLANISTVGFCVRDRQACLTCLACFCWPDWPDHLAKVVCSVLPVAAGCYPCSAIALQVHMSDSVTAINSQPPSQRYRPVHRGTAHTKASSMELYCVRPTVLSALTYKGFWRQFVVLRRNRNSKQKPPRGATVVLDQATQQPALSRCGGFEVYKLKAPALVRFSEYSPAHNAEGFFYNVLLDTVPFDSEAQLLSEGNRSCTYREECILRGLTTSDDSVEALVKK